jgi:acetylglutamate kinase
MVALLLWLRVLTLVHPAIFDPHHLAQDYIGETISMSQTHHTIVQLLSQISDKKEIRSYLNRFSEVGQTRFAVIKIGGAIIAEQLEETASALAFLHRVGLTPIVLHGGGPQLDEEITKRGIDTPKIDGLRVTNADALDAARDVFFGANIRLVEAIRRQGVAAHSLATGVLEAEYIDRDTFGLVGEPTLVRQGLLQNTVAAGAIPIISCMGIGPGGQMLNINGDSATRALVAALEPMKIIFLSSVGGLLGEDGAPLHSINLATDYASLMESDWVHSGMRLKLQEIAQLLDNAPLSTSVSITSPDGLLRELFTHGGSGTLVRKGEAINRLQEKDAIDAARLQALISTAFDRDLTIGWWDDLAMDSAYITQGYRACAIVKQLQGASYLDKFAVLEEARGEGLAHAIWRRITANHPRLFWRTHKDNGFNEFYAERASGSVKKGEWTIYWSGETDFAVIAQMSDAIAALPITLEAK